MISGITTEIKKLHTIWTDEITNLIIAEELSVNRQIYIEDSVKKVFPSISYLQAALTAREFSISILLFG